MIISVQPLRISYSFVANRRQALDRVDVAALDSVIAQITESLNDLLTALDVTMDDDGTLKDAVIEGRHFSDDALDQITSIVREELAGL